MALQECGWHHALCPGLKHNFMVMGHAHFYQRLFQLDVNRDGRAARTGKFAKASKVAKGPLFGLPAGVVPLSNNSCQNRHHRHDAGLQCARP